MAVVRRPVVAVVHEAAEPIGEGPDRGNPVARAVKGLNRKAFERLNRAGPPGAALAGCAAAVVHTGELRDWLTGLGLPPDRARHVLHPVFPLAPPAWTPAEVDARFGLGGRRVVAMVGFPDPRKGFDAAVRAVAGLPPDVVLAWAGGSRGCAVEAGLLDLAAELGMGDRFRRLGYLSEPELTAVLLRADVAVAPFRQVTGSGSVARLVAAGVPVIATDLRPLRELRDAGAGVELVTGDAVAVRAAVAAVLTDGQLADDLRAANCAFSAARGFGALAEEVLRAVREARPGGGRADREFAGPRTVSVPNATWSGK
jgi:glycosyltransferase involved in cell wall biosynthesis